MAANAKGHALEPTTRAKVLRLIERVGVEETARRLALSAYATARAGLGVGVQRATKTHIETRIDGAETE
jgi:hypothetical protein